MTFREMLGGLMNWLGWPGFVQETVYRSSKTTDLEVRVKKTRLYTIVSVNGVDVYFDRLTGCIDGTGISATSGSRWGLSARSTHLSAQICGEAGEMDGYYSMGEAAKKIGVHKMTLYQWERKGKVAAPKRIKRNNQRVYSEEDIARLIAYKNEMVEPTPPAAAAA